MGADFRRMESSVYGGWNVLYIYLWRSEGSTSGVEEDVLVELGILCCSCRGWYAHFMYLYRICYALLYL
jgi:hypothetical protein